MKPLHVTIRTHELRWPPCATAPDAQPAEARPRPRATSEHRHRGHAACHAPRRSAGVAALSRLPRRTPARPRRAGGATDPNPTHRAGHAARAPRDHEPRVHTLLSPRLSHALLTSPDSHSVADCVSPEPPAPPASQLCGWRPSPLWLALWLAPTPTPAIPPCHAPFAADTDNRSSKLQRADRRAFI